MKREDHSSAPGLGSEDDSEMKTAQMEAPAKKAAPAVEVLGTPGPKISAPEFEPPPPAPPRTVSADGLPLLTAATPEQLPDPAAKPPAPAPPAAAAPAKPAERPSAPQASLYEQLQAIEQAEAASARAAVSAAPGLPGPAPAFAPLAAARAAFAAPPPPPPPPPSHAAPAEVVLEAAPASEEPLELDHRPWSPERASAPRAQLAPGARPSAPRPSVPPASAPRPYVPLAPKVAVAAPPSRWPLALGTLAVAAAGVATAFAWLSLQQQEAAPADPAPLPAPAVVSRPAPAQPPPKPEPGKLRLTGLPRGAKVQLDGAAVSEPLAEQPLEAGAHQVRVEARGFAPWESSVELGSGEAKVLKVAMKKARKRR